MRRPSRPGAPPGDSRRSRSMGAAPNSGGTMEGRGRLGLALIVALISVFGYFASRSYNPVTQQTQHVNLTAGQEIALGLKAAPQMEAQYGGEADDPKGRQRVEAIGARLAARSPAHNTPYRFAYHLLKDPQTINAFALPGGQAFITEGLYRRLHTDGELAGVLGHETGDRKSTRLNSSHANISYAVFCLKKKRKRAVKQVVSVISFLYVCTYNVSRLHH